MLQHLNKLGLTNRFPRVFSLYPSLASAPNIVKNIPILTTTTTLSFSGTTIVSIQGSEKMFTTVHHQQNTSQQIFNLLQTKSPSRTNKLQQRTVELKQSLQHISTSFIKSLEHAWCNLFYIPAPNKATTNTMLYFIFYRLHCFSLFARRNRVSLNRLTRNPQMSNTFAPSNSHTSLHETTRVKSLCTPNYGSRFSRRISLRNVYSAKPLGKLY